MPELPEVETIRRGLDRRLRGRPIRQAEVRERRLRNPVSPDFSERLAGRTIRRVRRRAKYLLIDLEGSTVWLTHLGMSGKLILVSSERPIEKHDHIVVRLDRNEEIRYHDPRRFGLSHVLDAGTLEDWPGLRHLAVEPFDRRFNGDYLFKVARRSQRTIKDVLMDQRVVAGLGNIYVNEVLFRAGIRPMVRARRIGRKGIARIAEATPVLLREAIRWCGTSTSDYRDGEDRQGGFQDHLRVYQRAGERCRECPETVRLVRRGNRSSFYCPTCQR